MNTISAPPKVRARPRMSVSKLGEYSETLSASRRQRIIRDQKYPEDFIVPFYSQAQRAITAALSGQQNAIVDARASLTGSRASAQTEWELRRIESNLDALSQFSSNAWPDLSEAETMSIDAGQPKLALAQVAVSVEPELVTVTKNRRGEKEVGLVKLYLVKGHPLGEHGGMMAASVCHQWALANLDGLGAVVPKRVVFLDIFQGRTFEAPKAFKQRMSDASAACREIANQWPLITKDVA